MPTPIEIKVISSVDEAAADLATRINQHLIDHDKVLWLLSGGSAVAIAAQIWPQLNPTSPDQLMVGQIDERFGPLDHPNSNWLALTRAGLDFAQATPIPILRGQADAVATAKNYNDRLSAALKSADFRIGLLGIGTDGHTAGILPHSQAVFEQEVLAINYQGPDFNRITVTPKALGLLDLAAVYLQGSAKQPVLTQLSESIDPFDQPAQLLKLATQVMVYNNPND